MANNRSARKRSLLWGPSRGQLVAMMAFLLFLFGGIIFTLTATMQTTNIEPFAASCNDSGCQNVRWQKNPPIWQITNCGKDATSCDKNGDQQICTYKHFGKCGGKSYCCPGPGQQWTTNLAACKGSPKYNSGCTPSPTPTKKPTPTPTPEPTSTPTPTPTPVPTSTPTPTPEPTSTPTPTPTPTATPTPYIYYVAHTPADTPTPTPTPTTYILNSCNKACLSNADCPGGLTCATAFGQQVCRNPLCADQFSCLCGQSSFSNLSVSPTPNETGLGGGPQVAITVSSFTDSNGLASSQPTITGLTEPGALVTVSIFPDGVSGTVTADASGRWSWRATKALTPGQKSLLVVAKNASGAQGQVNQTFTVAASKGGSPWGVIILVLVLIGLGFGGYVYYKSNNP